MKCPCCEEGELEVVREQSKIPDWLLPPVYECSECGDLVSMAPTSEYYGRFEKPQ